MTDMGDSETFGVERGHGKEVVAWLNEYSKEKRVNLEARLYGRVVSTSNFGDFEMFSWIGNVQAARKLTIKASKRFKVKVIEGGYKPKERVFRIKKFDYGIVRKGDKNIGQIEFVASRLGNNQWEIINEERH